MCKLCSYLNSYKPFHKLNSQINYIHRESNHPPSTIKQLSLSVESHLSKLSSDENVFIQAASVYQEALKRAGYNHKLSHNTSDKYNSKNNNKNNNNNNNSNNNHNKNSNNNNNNNNDNNNHHPRRGKNRNRNIICFNPRFSKNLASKIGRYFLNLVESSRPKIPQNFQQKQYKS